MSAPSPRPESPVPVGAEWLEKLPLRDPRIDENRYQVRPLSPS